MTSQGNYPAVSVVMPAHNAVRFLDEAVQSVRAQTFVSWELLIVNDRSSDATLKKAQAWSKLDPRILVFDNLKEPPGAASARNTAIECARGRFIAFLDSDDVWLPRKLEIQLNSLSDPAVVLVYSAYQVMNEQGAGMGVRQPRRNTLNYKQLLRRNEIGCLTAIYDTHKVGKLYCPLLFNRNDYGIWLQALRGGGVAVGVADVLAKYRVCASSLCSRKLRGMLNLWFLFRKYEQLSLLRSMALIIVYSCESVPRFFTDRTIAKRFLRP